VDKKTTTWVIVGVILLLVVVTIVVIAKRRQQQTQTGTYQAPPDPYQQIGFGFGNWLGSLIGRNRNTAPAGSVAAGNDTSAAQAAQG